MPDSGYIKKSTARNIIVGIFVFFSFAVGAGAQYAKQQATDQAVKINNRTTCAFRDLVDTPIAGYRRTIALAQHVADDTSRNKKVRASAAKSVAANQKTLDGLIKFRAVYNTVPPGYKCPKVTNG